MNPARLLLVIPCYNEEAILYRTYAKLNTYYNGIKEQGLIAEESRICFVNDGSRDKTWQIIEELAAKDASVIIDRVQEKLRHLSACRNLPVDVRCKIGYAFSENPPETSDEFLRIADEHMQGKRTPQTN